MLKNSFDNINLQNRALDVSWLKHDIIAQNIANSETPGYKRKKVVFDGVLEAAMSENMTPLKRTHSNHIASPNLNFSPAVITDMDAEMRIDGNSVDIDIEMAEEAKNSIKYNAMINQVSAQLRRLRASIKGGL